MSYAVHTVTMDIYVFVWCLGALSHLGFPPGRDSNQEFALFYMWVGAFTLIVGGMVRMEAAGWDVCACCKACNKECNSQGTTVQEYDSSTDEEDQLRRRLREYD